MHRFKNDNDGAYLRRTQNVDEMNGLIPSTPSPTLLTPPTSAEGAYDDADDLLMMDYSRKKGGGKGRAKVVELGDGEVFSLRIPGGRNPKRKASDVSSTPASGKLLHYFWALFTFILYSPANRTGADEEQWTAPLAKVRGVSGGNKTPRNRPEQAARNTWEEDNNEEVDRRSDALGGLLELLGGGGDDEDGEEREEEREEEVEQVVASSSASSGLPRVIQKASSSSARNNESSSSSASLRNQHQRLAQQEESSSSTRASAIMTSTSASAAATAPRSTRGQNARFV